MTLPSLAALCDLIPSDCTIDLDEYGNRDVINVAPGSEQQAAQLTRVVPQWESPCVKLSGVDALDFTQQGERMGASSSARMLRALGEGMPQRVEAGYGTLAPYLYNFTLDREGMAVSGAGCWAKGNSCVGPTSCVPMGTGA